LNLLRAARLFLKSGNAAGALALANQMSEAFTAASIE
jgi:hypothetical protein